MNEQYLKGFFDTYVSPNKQDSNYDSWLSAIKDNDDYKQGMFAYVQEKKPDADYKEWSNAIFGTDIITQDLVDEGMYTETGQPLPSVDPEADQGPLQRDGVLGQAAETASNYFTSDLPKNFMAATGYAAQSVAGDYMGEGVELSGEDQLKLSEMMANPETPQDVRQSISNVLKNQGVVPGRSIGADMIRTAEEVFPSYNPDNTILSYTQVETPEDAAAYFVNNAIKGGGQILTAIATSGASIIPETIGDVYKEAIDEKVAQGMTMDEAASSRDVLVTTGVISATVGLLEKYGIDKIFGGNKGAARVSIKGFIKNASKSFGIESVTEMLQEFAQYMGIKVALDGDVSTEELATRVIDAGLAGGISGSTVSSAGYGVSAAMQKAAGVSTSVDEAKDDVADTGDITVNEEVDKSTRGVLASIKAKYEESKKATATETELTVPEGDLGVQPEADQDVDKAEKRQVKDNETVFSQLDKAGLKSQDGADITENSDGTTTMTYVMDDETKESFTFKKNKDGSLPKKGVKRETTKPTTEVIQEPSEVVTEEAEVKETPKKVTAKDKAFEESIPEVTNKVFSKLDRAPEGEPTVTRDDSDNVTLEYSLTDGEGNPYTVTVKSKVAAKRGNIGKQNLVIERDGKVINQKDADKVFAGTHTFDPNTGEIIEIPTKKPKEVSKPKAKAKVVPKVKKIDYEGKKITLNNQISNITKKERASRPSDQISRLQKIIDNTTDPEFKAEVDRAKKELAAIQERVENKKTESKEKNKTNEDRIGELKEAKNPNAPTLESAYETSKVYDPNDIDDAATALETVQDLEQTLDNLEDVDDLGQQGKTKKIVSEIKQNIKKIKQNEGVKALLDIQKKEAAEGKKTVKRVGKEVDELLTQASIDPNSTTEVLSNINKLRESVGLKPMSKAELDRKVKSEFIQEKKAKAGKKLREQESKKKEYHVRIANGLKTSKKEGERQFKLYDNWRKRAGLKDTTIEKTVEIIEKKGLLAEPTKKTTTKKPTTKKPTTKKETKPQTQAEIEADILNQLNALDKDAGFEPGAEFNYNGKKTVAVPFKGLEKISLSSFVNIIRQTANSSKMADAFLELLDKVNTIRENQGMPPVRFYMGTSNDRDVSGMNAQSGDYSAIILDKDFRSVFEHTALHEFIHEYHGMLAQLAYAVGKDNKFNSEVDEVFTNSKAYIDQVMAQIELQEALGEQLTEKQEIIKKLYQELTRKNLGFTSLPTDIYGFSSRAEFLAEAFSNPLFIQLLNEVDGKGYTPNSTKSTIYKIYDSFIEFIKKNIPEFYENNKSAFSDLTAIVSNFETELFERADQLVLSNRDLVMLNLSKRTDEQKFKDKIRTVISIDIAAREITTPKEIVSEANKLAKEAGIELDEKDTKSITKRVNNFSNQEKIIRTLTNDVRAKMNNDYNYNNDPFYRSYMDDLLNINLSVLKIKDRAVIIQGLNDAITLGEYDSKVTNKIIDTKVKARLEKLAKFKDLKVGNITQMSKLYNPSQIVTFLGKFDQDFADTLFESLYYGIGVANVFSKNAVQKDIVSSGNKKKPALIELSKKLGLTTKDHIKAYMYATVQPEEGGALSPDEWQAQLEKNIDNELKSLDRKLQAVDRKSKAFSYSGKTILDVKEEIAILTELKNDFKINDKQQQLLDAFKSILDKYSNAARINTTSVHNKEFNSLQYYIPKKAVGKSKGNFVDNTFGDDLVRVLEGAEGAESVNPSQAGFTKDRAQQSNVFYEYDLLKIANQYVSSVTYDVMATKEIKAVNKLLSSSAFKGIVGVNNAKVVRDRIAHNIRSAVSKGFDFNPIVRKLESVKNAIITTKLGTSTQFLIQAVAAIPNIIAMNPKGAVKALPYITSPRGTEKLRQFIEANNISIKIRDVLFERFDKITDFDKKSLGRAVAKAGALSEKTTTFSLRSADKLAAKYAWFAAYFEAGGTLENPSMDAVIRAENMTNLSQNVSDATFSPEFLNPRTNTHRLFVSAFMSFKSFSLNQNITNIKALGDINKPYARKLLVANMVNAMSYEIISKLIVKPIFELAADVVMNTTSYAEPEEEDESTYSLLEEIGVKTILGAFFSGIGPLSDVISYIANNFFPYPQIKTKKTLDENLDPINVYDAYKDSPLYSASSLGKMAVKSAGPYGELLNDMDTYARMSDPNNLEEVKDYEKLGLARQAITVFPFLPFRGDMARIMREVEKDLKIRDKRLQELRKELNSK